MDQFPFTSISSESFLGSLRATVSLLRTYEIYQTLAISKFTKKPTERVCNVCSSLNQKSKSQIDGGIVKAASYPDLAPEMD